MKVWLSLCLSTVAAFGCTANQSTDAYAADSESPPSWTGAYFGAGGGGAYLKAKNDAWARYFEGVQDYSSPPNYVYETLFYAGSSREDGDIGAASLSQYGAFGTLKAGYDIQASGIVLGVFGNGDFGSTEARDEGICVLRTLCRLRNSVRHRQLRRGRCNKPRNSRNQRRHRRKDRRFRRRTKPYLRPRRIWPQRRGGALT